MSIEASLEASRVVNGAGFATRLGGAIMRDSVVSAMANAAQFPVDMTSLQATASRHISRLTGGEAGLVTSGATAALQLASAASLAGLDVGVMDRLPDTSGIPNEIVMYRTHRTGYDHGLRAAGAVIHDVGYNTRGVGAGGRGVEAWEVHRAIGANTVAIAATATPMNLDEIAVLARIATEADLPLIVDAAAQLPPKENLRRFLDLGASLVAFSGGKAVRGPQETGFLAGRRDLIMSAALQMLDMDEAVATWRPPRDFIDLDLIAGLPQHGIGRGLKVSKEGVVGLLTALDEFLTGEDDEPLERASQTIDRIEQGLSEMPGIRVVRIEGTRWGWPRLELHVAHPSEVATAHELSLRLKRLSPGVFLNEQRLSEGILLIDPANLRESDADVILSSIAKICDDKAAGSDRGSAE